MVVDGNVLAISAAVVAVALVFGAVWLFRTRDTWKSRPGFFFCVDVLTVLVLLLAALHWGRSGQAWPGWDFSFAEVVPLWVPWAGALGGTTISLVGVVKHYADWKEKYAYWHLARPLLGGVCGTIGVLIVVLLLKSVEATADGDGSGVRYDAAGIAVLSVIAFVLGYREQTFRHLVERVADVILAPGDTSATDVVVFVPETVTLGSGVLSATVHLANYSPDALTFTLAVDPADAFTAAAADTTAIAAASSREITITRDASVAAAATVTATLGGHEARLRVVGSA